MSPTVYSQVIELSGLVIDQASKSLGGMLAMVGEPANSISWVQTGILGVVVLAIFWGFKSGFLALGRELEREREINRKQEKTINDQRNLIAAVIMQSGQTLPILTETAQQIAVEKDEQTARILGMMDELKDAITHGPPL